MSEPAEKAKPIKGRKRHPKKVATAGAEAAEPAEPAQASTQPQEATDELPKPTLSQRITQSLKQLSQLGAVPKQEEGEEVEQGSGKVAIATKSDEGQAPPSEEGGGEASAKRPSGTRRKLRFTAPLQLTARAASCSVIAVLLLTAGLGYWRCETTAFEQVGTQLAVLRSEGAQLAEQLQQLQQAQWQLEDRLASLTTAQQQLRASTSAEAADAAKEEVASLGSVLDQLQEAVAQQAELITQLRAQQHAVQQRGGQGESKDEGPAGCATAPPAEPPPPPVLSAEEVAGLVRAEVQGALALFEADRTGMPDYALSLAGGKVLSHSRLQHAPGSSGLVGRLAQLFGPHDVHPDADKFLLTPVNELGKCLPLAGSSGHVDLQLAQPIHPTAFTYEHIPAAIAFHIRTAPHTLSVYALPGRATSQGSELLGNATATKAGGGSGGGAGGSQLLGRLVYNPGNGGAVQTVPLASLPSGEAVGRVRVEVEDNHGHPDYTCLYRMRLHGMSA